MNPEKPGTTNGYWMPTIVFDRSWHFNRQKLLDRFKAKNIDGRVFFYPLSMMPMFPEQRRNVVSYDLYERAINLPSYHDITNEDIQYVVDIVKQVIGQ